MSNSKGQSLIDVLIALAVGGIISLGVGTIITFGAEQFNALRDQNLAEENLIRAAYYLRVQMSNAVKTYCCSNVAGCNAAGSIPVGYDATVPGVDFDPMGLSQGVVDCRAINLASLAIWTSAVQPLGVFIRENGDVPAAGPAGAPAVTTYVGTGIQFQRPTDPVATGAPGTSGILYFATADAAGNIDANMNQLFFDRLVNIGVEGPPNIAPAPPTGTGALASIDFRIRARYFKKVTNVALLDYRPEAVNGTPNVFRDIDLIVSIPFRNNIIGFLSNGSASQTAERIHGGIYYFKFATPPFSFENL